jgi:carboxymethylenebutenolidase
MARNRIREAGMSGQLIKVAAADGEPMGAYLAVPAAGNGPGLMLLDGRATRHDTADLFAAEGYVVLCPEPPGGGAGAAVGALRVRPECTGKIGALGFADGGGLALRAAATGDVDCAVAYEPGGIRAASDVAARTAAPLVVHLAERDPAVARIAEMFTGHPRIAVHVYPGTLPGFADKSGAQYQRSAAGLAHSRSIALFRRVLGPDYDLEKLWDAHTNYEFVTRDVAATMRTMVAEPYVNHVPVMTGGVGARDLARFYANHFIPKCPKDIAMVPVSRTIGADRVVDEMVVSFTHDTEIDWMLPGVAPTGRRVEVPLVAIVGFRGDKLYHEHIYWDQASVLLQIGLLDPQGLPVAGAETAHKLLDETQPSNSLMRRWADSAA